MKLLLYGRRLQHRLRISCAPRHPSLDHLRCDNGAEFVAGWVRQWLHRVGRQMLFAELGSPERTRYLESFNSKLSDELFSVETFDTSLEAQVLVE